MRIRLLVLINILILFGCSEREYPQPFPIAITYEVVNISSEGAEFRGSIESLGTDQKIIKYGFEWVESDNPKIKSSFLVISDNIKEGSFSKKVTNDMLVGANYLVRAFVQTDKLIVYGNPISFVSKGSQPPTIVDFTPQRGFDGTEIIIEGINFSPTQLRNLVKLGDAILEVVSASETELKVILPSSTLVGDFKISLTVAGKEVFSDKSFSILGPRITAVSKASGRVGDLITMQGEYFEETNYLSLYFGPVAEWRQNYSYPYIKSTTQLECYVPDNPGTNGKIELFSYPQNLQLREKKFIFSEDFEILDSWSKNSEQVPIESNRPGTGPAGYQSVQLNNFAYVIGGKTLHEYDLNSRQWTKRADFPGEYRFFGIAFSFEGKLYYGFGQGYYEPPFVGENGKYFNDLWRYDPISNSWEKLADTPVSERAYAISFVINSKVYLGLGFSEINYNSLHHNDIWELDLNTGSWAQISTPFTKSFLGGTSFVVNNKAYLVGIEQSDPVSDVWEFDPQGSAWVRKLNYPDELRFEVATSSSNRGFLFSTRESHSIRAYEYNPSQDLWIKRQTLRESKGLFQFLHFYNDKLILCTENIWELEF